MPILSRMRRFSIAANSFGISVNGFLGSAIGQGQTGNVGHGLSMARGRANGPIS